VEYQLVSVTEAVEYGLKTPSGEVIWPPLDYRGFAIDTEAARSDLPNVLRVCAGELKLDPEPFVAGFRWVPRSVTTMVVAKVFDESIPIDGLVLPPSVDAESPPSTPND
jgi:hypothetical protein